MSEPRELPRIRKSRTYSFHVADSHGFLTAGEYEDGTLGEIFLIVTKQGSTLSGIMDSLAISVSIGLQNGTPLSSFVDLFVGMRFEPFGQTDDPEIPYAASITDYIFRRLALDFLTDEERANLKPIVAATPFETPSATWTARRAIEQGANA